jgi:hypothetical protein
MAARTAARFRPAIEAVGERCLGQLRVQLSWLWQRWQPASTATAEMAQAVAIAHVVEECPSAVQGRRAEIVGVPADHIAGGVAYAAADALDAGIGRLALGARRLDPGELGGALGRWHEAAPRLLPALEEWSHVDHEVADDREVTQRCYPDAAILRHPRRLRAARPARGGVDLHGAGAAHADTAGEAVGKGRIEPTLHVGDDVEHGLLGPCRHAIGDEAAVRAAAPDQGLDLARPCHPQRSMPHLRTVRSSIVRKTTFSTRRPMMMTVTSPAKT